MSKLSKWFDLHRIKGGCPVELAKPEAASMPETESAEYLQYCVAVEKTLTALEAELHSSDDPEEIAMAAMKTACDFYQADWAGLLEVDMDLGIWTPFWWYNRSPRDKTVVMLEEFESSKFLYRWISAMYENHAIIVPDAEAIRETWPDEYAVYQRLHIKSVIGVPIKPRPVAFLAVRNPQRYLEHSSMLQMLAFVVLTNVNEKKLLDSAKMALSPEAIQSDKDIIINLFGNMEIYTLKGVLREQDFKAPKCCRVVVYLLLNRKAPHTPQEIASALWPNDPSEPEALCSNVRGLIYRFRQAFSLISDYQLIVSTPNGYRLNPELRIMTDLQQFDKLWDAVQNATATTRKIDLLKQSVALYKGQLFESASDEHWIVNMVTNYHLRYVGMLNELLFKLAEAHDYFGVQQYATQALNLEPGSVKTRYWLILAICHMGEMEMAKSEVERAKANLTDEEYEALVKYLKRNKDISPNNLFDDVLGL